MDGRDGALVVRLICYGPIAPFGFDHHLLVVQAHRYGMEFTILGGIGQYVGEHVILAPIGEGALQPE